MDDADGGKAEAGKLAVLFAEHAPRLRRLLRGMLVDPARVEDALQATFVKALEKQAERTTDEPKAWLYRVAVNEALAVRRQEKRRADLDRRWVWRHAAETPDDSLAKRELTERLRGEVAALPQELRTVVEARLKDEKTFAQIAADLGWPLGTVLTRMRTALERLRRAFPDEMDGVK
ncbi:MAG TPA: sigma-70 family RNA polymerase sigma factor [Planctomycetia bacterium]|nr:sigma-70 family RNA polymerase sigma factor [Planctomycetia bacterium]